VLSAFLERADPRDALVSSGGRLAELRAGASVGTTSLRRRALVRGLRPELRLEDLRGNVDTRLRRLREGRFDAILLAMAGLTRLGRADEVTEILDPRGFVPAPGQGAIALECREADAAVRDAVAPLHHPATARSVSAERSFLAALGGGCNVPLGAHALACSEGLELVAFVAAPDGRTILRAERRGEDPDALGRALADELLARGARSLIGG
jgi:hydroxymethylbilane synthase